MYRYSRPEVFCKKGVLGNFAKFIGKHLCQNLFFNKVAGLRPEPCNFVKKETLAQVFSCEFCEISRNTFSYRTLPVAASECKLARCLRNNLQNVRKVTVFMHALCESGVKVKTIFDQCYACRGVFW